MEIFKVGDIVHVKENADEIEPFAFAAFPTEMLIYRGHDYKITSIVTGSRSGNSLYTLGGVYDLADHYSWFWDANWLESVTEIDVQEDDLINLLKE